jgi:O-antigen ligase
MKNITYKFFPVLISLLFIFPILKENLSSIITIFLCLNTLLYTISIRNYKSINLKVLGLTIPFWIILFRSLFTDNYPESINQISHSLFFLIFPITFYNIPKEFFKIDKINLYLSILKNICLIISVIYVISFFVNVPAWKYEIVSQNISVFRDYIYNDFKTFVIHPTYYTTILIFCSAHSLELVLDKKKYYEIIFVIVFLTITVLLLPRLNIVLILSTLFYILLFRNKLSIQKKWSAFVAGICLISGLIYITPGITERFQELYSSFNVKPENVAYDSTNVRMAIFDSSIAIAKENWVLGVGFENLQGNLNDQYKQNYDSSFYINQNYMTHNYYFYIFLSAGILGLLAYLFYLVYVISICLKSNIFLFKVFLVNVLVVCFTEDFFYRHYGILYFNLFLLCFIRYSENLTEENKLKSNLN